MKRDILILGNPILRVKSEEITDFQNKKIREEINDLKDTLEDFRKKNGFGRGIAAIQIGIEKRIIALNLGKEAFVLINPRITWYSSDSFTLWDDCMSFPDFVVRVRRNTSISMVYQDELGNTQKWDNIGKAESELLQHEIDHLDGILAIDKAIEKQDILYKMEYRKAYEHYSRKVDYEIVPTIN